MDCKYFDLITHKHTSVLALTGAVVSEIIVKSKLCTSLKSSSISFPSCIQSKLKHLADNACSSPLPFFKHLSNPSDTVTFLLKKKTF
jgi:hypothetical protein